MDDHAFTQTVDETPLQFMRRLIDTLEKFQLDIEAALCYGGNTHSFDDVARGVFSGDYELIHSADAIVLGEVMNFPKLRCYHVFIAAGELQAVLDLQPNVLRSAARFGCTKLTLAGRFGWQRALKDHGWKPELVFMTKDVPTQLGEGSDGQD